MTIEQYNRIAELAEQGKTGIEIVATINEESKQSKEPEGKTEPEKKEPEGKTEPEPKTEPETEEKIELLKRIDALDKRLAKMQETFHAVNIMNSSQPEAPTKGSKDILAEVFAGYTDAHEKGE